MNCQRAEYLIAALVSGTIEQSQENRLLEHIDRCPACRAVYEKQKAVEEELRSLTAPAPDAEFARRVAELAEHIKQRGRRPTVGEMLPWIGPVPAVGIASAAVVGGVWALMGSAFIEWIENGFGAIADVSMASLSGVIVALTMLITLLGLFGFGLLKAVRDF
jgi:anti-sigma factor RsiW